MMTQHVVLKVFPLYQRCLAYQLIAISKFSRSSIIFLFKILIFAVEKKVMSLRGTDECELLQNVSLE
jgi:hypothetical protein